jgi:hypothetical protein
LPARARPFCDKCEYTGGSAKTKGKLNSAFEKADTSADYPYGAMHFIPALAIHFRIAKTVKSCRRWHGVFKELSQDGGRADYTKHLRASLFNKGLSNEPNFGRIHLLDSVDSDNRLTEVVWLDIASGPHHNLVLRICIGFKGDPDPTFQVNAVPDLFPYSDPGFDDRSF